MSLPLIVRPSAEADIQAIHEYLETVQPGLERQFAAQLRDVFERVETAPLTCGVIWNDVRAVRVRRFQYVMYYKLCDDRIEVLAVLHGARQESLWKSRTES